MYVLHKKVIFVLPHVQHLSLTHHHEDPQACVCGLSISFYKYCIVYTVLLGKQKT